MGESALALIAVKVAGAFGGGIIALVAKPTTLWKLRWRRLFVSVVAGALTEPVARHTMGWPATVEFIAASACIMGAVSWWAAPALIRSVKGE